MAQQLHLPEGRIVEYLVSGDLNGFPLVWIHGTPGAYLPVPSLVAACKKKGVKVISLSRAGYGGSSRNKGRRVVDAVADIQAVNKHLGIERCLVGGWSGGGPHALACAARLPGCIAALSVAGPAPYDAEGLDFLAGQGEDNIQEFHAALKGEEELQKFCGDQRQELLEADVAGLTEALDSLLPEVDKQAMTDDPEMGQYTVDLFREALRIGCDGWVDDDLACITSWGFEFGEIKVPVLLYQGTEDKMVPYAHGEWLAEHLPQDKLRKHLISGEGHMSIFIGQRDHMIDELVEIANK
ncbi:putative valacyclovir hydrolase [Acephala macrosclerotiorum]|nr:putative valacyclovir hydrolase [Acephala macrosclerotiorum]